MRSLVSELQVLARFWIMAFFAIDVPEDKTTNAVASKQSAKQDRAT
jgi:hypothetical protein